MVTATGRCISDIITETGQLVFGGLTDTGEYADEIASSGPLYELTMSGGVSIGGSLDQSSGYILITTGYFVLAGNFNLPAGIPMSGGMVVGGQLHIVTKSSIAMSGGFVVGASVLKKQLPCDLYTPSSLEFGLTDASINFKLEQQP